MIDSMQIQSIKDLVNAAAVKYGARDAFRWKMGGQLLSKSYLDVKADSMAFGRMLEKYDMQRAHVAVIGPTTYEWIITYFGTVSSGGVIVPLDAQLPPDGICELLCRADISVFVYDDLFSKLIPLVRAKCPNIKLFFNMQQAEDGENGLSLHRHLGENAGEIDVEIDCEKLCSILFTSGTTGKSKGVMLSHKNMIDNALCMDMHYEGEQECILTVLPIHHAYCFTCDILQVYSLGVPICINDSIMHLARNLAFFKPTIMLLVPMIVESMYRQICEAAKKNPGAPKQAIAQAAFGGRLRIIFSGGAYLNPDLIEKYEELGIRLLQGYGMTECSPRISANTEEQEKAGSVGKLVKGCQVKIVDHEIWAKSGSVMLGYYKDEAATAETLEDGWLKTGDLGYVDADGYLFLTGRKKNLIILSNGENISPEEMENMLSSAPLVREVLVYGENNVITAEIFPDYDYVKEQGITDMQAALEALLEEKNRTLPLYKQIHGLKIRETEFEKTPSQKIKRKYS